MELHSPLGSPMAYPTRYLSSLMRQQWLAYCSMVGLGLLALSLQAAKSVSTSAPVEIAPLQLADVIINAPIIINPGEVEAKREVVVDFIGLGRDWGTVYLNGQVLYRPQNHNRRQQFLLEEGAYYLEITGIVRSERWASGYLDVGRLDANVLVVRFSKRGGVYVVGDPYAWIPD